MKKMKLYGLAGVAALAAVGGTFAYYSASQTFSNPFNTTKYSTSSTEKFNPNGDNKDWKPGVEVDKKVYATNTGDGDVWVRIKFGEKWMDENGVLLGLPKKDDDYHFTSKDGLVIFGVREDDDFTDSSAYQGKDDDYEKDGIISSDTGSVVGKTFAENYENNWYYNANDGYFYYRKVLASKETTETLLESVTLYKDTDMGHFDDVEYYIALDAEPATVPEFDVENWSKSENMGKDYKGWTWGTPDKDDVALKDKYVYTYKANLLDEENSGYANANYQLDITVDFLQTTEDGEMITTAEWDQAALKVIGLLKDE